ncbi:MAG: hypothetical protein R8K50_08195 [Mariprofundus sp.]
MAQAQHYFDKVPVLVEIALVVFMAWMVAGWLMPSQQQAVDESNAPQAMVMTLPNLADLVAVPLFGTLSKQVVAQAPVKAAPKPVVQSPLKLKLLGTVMAGDDSVAISGWVTLDPRSYFLLVTPFRRAPRWRRWSLKPSLLIIMVEWSASVCKRAPL